MKSKLGIISILMSIFLISCSSNNQNQTTYETDYQSEYSGVYDEKSGIDDVSENASIEVSGENIKDNRKIERFYDYQVETINFEQDNKSIETLVDKYDGFYESSTISFDTINRTDDKLKSLNAVIKIPKDSSNKFKGEFEKIGQILSSSNRINDITKSYTDINIRLKSKETELNKLNELVENATKLEDVMAIESRILEVQADIDQIKAAISDMDSRITYDTYNLSLREVYDYNSINNKNPNFLERLGRAFADSIQIFKNFIQEIIIAIAALWPILLIIIIIVFVVSKRKKKRLEKINLNRDESND